jgi:heat shock protein HslJ
VAGKSGCNSYFGTYQLNGNQLTFGTLGGTEMYCGSPAGIMDQESTYLALLGGVKSYRLQNGQLVMLDSAGKDVLVYSSLEPTSLVGTSWQVIDYNNGKDAVVSVLGGTSLTAEFGEDGSITGSAGCNNYFGKYEVDGNTIKIGPLASTKMACAEPTGIMEQEDAFLIALQSATTFQITGDQLVLHNADGSRAVDFLTGISQTLEGSSWELLSITGYDGELTTAKADTPISLVFDQSGNLSGFSGCNQYSGGYTVNGSEIKIGPLVSTQMACLSPANVMELESKYLASLQAAASFQFVNGTLILHDAEGKQLLEFQTFVP